MAAEDNEKEDLDDGGLADAKKKLYKWLPFGLLLLFLAGGGYYALTAMRQAAHKLAGGENYKQLSANSSVYDGKATVALSKDSFAYEEEALAEGPAAAAAAGKDKEKTALNKALAAGQAASGEGLTQASMPAEEQQQASAAGASAAGASPSTMAARLQTKVSGFSQQGGGAGGSRTSAQGGVAGFQGNGTVVGKTSVERETAAGSAKKGGRTSVLDSLKGSFRASLYGARLSSQDSAKSWIAKTFDATPDYDTAIQYDENMRAKLDKVNPNSIPKFLREQDISAAEAKTLAASDVAKPTTEVDKDATKEALDQDKSYQDAKAKKAAADMASGVLNSLFSGLGSSLDSTGAGDDKAGAGDGDTVGAGGDDRMNMASDPNADPNLIGVDEFGNRTMAGPGGLNYIYSAEGDLLGCEDSAAGMCLMAGYGGCM